MNYSTGIFPRGRRFAQKRRLEPLLGSGYDRGSATDVDASAENSGDESADAGGSDNRIGPNSLVGDVDVTGLAGQNELVGSQGPVGTVAETAGGATGTVGDATGDLGLRSPPAEESRSSPTPLLTNGSGGGPHLTFVSAPRQRSSIGSRTATAETLAPNGGTLLTGRFENKTALVVGASRGIGFATAKGIAEEGGAVAITGRNDNDLSEAARNISSASGATVIPVPGHARRPEQRRATVERAVRELGKLDVLVYTTATNILKDTPALELDPEILRKEFDLNVVAALEYVKLVHHASMRDNGGSVVLLGSVASSGNVRLPAYSMTKAALESMCRSMADQLAPGVRVNGIAPGFVDTEFAASLQHLPKERIDASYPMGREGTPEDVARAMTFLASEEARWITGTTLVVDGGKLVQPSRHDLSHPRVGQAIH